MIKVSVIVPCYNVEKYLPKCLDSLVNQTLKEIEVICINDGATDNTLSILKDYEKRYKNKIVIIDKKNEGVWKGRWDGIRKAKGEYIGFVDSDDYVNPNFALKLYNAAKKTNADLTVCGFDRIDLDTQKLYSREMCKTSKSNFNINEEPGNLLELNGAPWNKLFKASILKKSHSLETIPKVLDDMMFNQLYYLNIQKVVFIPDSLINYMVRKDSIINTINVSKLDSVYKSMLEIRNFYKKERKDLLDYVDANAFLHLGISLMYRLSENKDVDFKKVLKDNTEYLKKNFPNYKTTKYTKLSYIITHRGVNFKLWVVKCFYNLGLFRLFLATYKFMIKRLKIDIKW